MLSVIVPTRNRAELWRTGWLTDQLAGQTQVPDELVVALDHTEDATIAAIRDRALTYPLPFPVRFLEVLSPRAGEHQASAIADNCLFAAATGDILVHLDDDISLGSGFCRRADAHFTSRPRSVIWAHLCFIAAKGSPLAGRPPVDRRPAMAAKHRWPMLPDRIYQLPAGWPVHWGGAWAARRADILAIGGHDLNLARFRNADARLGNRLVRAGITSYVTSTSDLAADHLGTTHHARSRHADRRARNPATLGAERRAGQPRDRSRGPTSGPAIANGGPAYWTSDACRQSYREI